MFIKIILLILEQACSAAADGRGDGSTGAVRECHCVLQRHRWIHGSVRAEYANAGAAETVSAEDSRSI